MKEIQQELHLNRPPLQIECFDNSNIQGSDAVAACVVFKKAKPSKKDYRKYNIKTVVGPDDYASMKEVVRRRYQRAIEENAPLPDLIITDGGKGQMEVVREVIEDELNLTNSRLPDWQRTIAIAHRNCFLDFLRRLSVSNSKARYSVC